MMDEQYFSFLTFFLFFLLFLAAVGPSAGLAGGLAMCRSVISFIVVVLEEGAAGVHRGHLPISLCTGT
jgi:hypothetical protein